MSYKDTESVSLVTQLQALDSHVTASFKAVVNQFEDKPLSYSDLLQRVVHECGMSFVPCEQNSEFDHQSRHFENLINSDGPAVYIKNDRGIYVVDSSTKKEELIIKLSAHKDEAKVFSIDLSPDKKSIIYIEFYDDGEGNILLIDVPGKKIRALWRSPLIISAKFMHDSVHCLCTTDQYEGQLVRVMNFFLPSCSDSDGFPCVDWFFYDNPKLLMKMRSENSLHLYEQVYEFDGAPFDVKACMVHIFENTHRRKIVSTHRQKPLIAINGQIFEEVRAAEINKLTTVEQLQQALVMIRKKKEQNMLDDAVVQAIIKDCC